MRFRDRRDAGLQLAKNLMPYHGATDTIVIGLARGGVVVADVVAKALDLPVDVMIIRKIGALFNEELAIGAIDEEGHGVLNEELIRRLGISSDYVQLESEKQKGIAQQRAALYRKEKKRKELKGQTVIVVDDGIATGASMKAAIQVIKQKGVQKIVLAVPVAPPDSLKEISALVDETVCLYAPESFSAVGQFYVDFDQTSDAEVVRILLS